MLVIAILGIVASVTIPSLIKSYQKTTWTSSFKNIYSELGQATVSVMLDNGGTMKGIAPAPCDGSLNNCLRDAYLANMKDLKTCDSGETGGVCWHESNEWYGLQGSPQSSDENNMSVLIAPNGAIINFNVVSNDCTGTPSYLIDPIGCGRIRVDVNGFNSPNTVGRDIFDIYILENRIVPKGTNLDTSSCPADHGYGCAGKILRENAMNY